jgi:hypothetical protein
MGEGSTFLPEGKIMKIKTSELTGAALDWAVAKCEGTEHLFAGHEVGRLRYTTDWAQGGPIIEREGISLACRPKDARGLWCAVLGPNRFLSPDFEGYGPTPLVAAMRCYVASRLGEEVDVPDELI